MNAYFNALVRVSRTRRSRIFKQAGVAAMPKSWIASNEAQPARASCAESSGENVWKFLSLAEFRKRVPGFITNWVRTQSGFEGPEKRKPKLEVEAGSIAA